MEKVLFMGGALLFFVVFMVITTSDIKNPNKKNKIASVVAVIAMAAILMCGMFSNVTNGGVTDNYTVAFISDETITLIDESNGDTVKIATAQVTIDNSLQKGDKVVVVQSTWGDTEYIGKVAGELQQPKTTPAE